MLISSLLSCSVGLVSSVASHLRSLRFTCLEWYHSHLKTCYFQSALFQTESQSTLFQTDSQTTLALLFTAPAFSSQVLSGIFETSPTPFRIALSFQWVFLGHPGLSVTNCRLARQNRNELQTRSPKPQQHSPSPSKGKAYPLHDLETKSFSQLSVFPSGAGIFFKQRGGSRK